VAGRIEQGINRALAQMRRDTVIGRQATGKKISFGMPRLALLDIPRRARFAGQ